MHDWSEKEMDWEGLHKAGTEIADYVYKYSGCTVVWKEKYGTLRIEWIRTPFFSNSSNSMLSRVRHLWVKYAYYLLTKAMGRVIFKYPHLYQEILDDYMDDLIIPNMLVDMYGTRGYFDEIDK